MRPNNRVLTALADLCSVVAKSGRVAPPACKEGQELRDEWDVLLLRSDNPSLTADEEQQIEAQAEDLAARIVYFLAAAVTRLLN